VGYWIKASRHLPVALAVTRRNPSFGHKALTLLRTALDDPSATFRDGQLEAIEHLVEQRERLLVVQRTGWGKSIVYFIATRLLREQGSGITLLVSPLLSLMRNQIDAAGRIGLRAETINSSNTDDWERVVRQIKAGRVDLLLISPERLANDNFRRTVLLPLQRGIGLFVVDEAHCISDWGHDFRPDYRRIRALLEVMPRTVPVLATTATANDRVVADVQVHLGGDVRILRGPLARESLRLQNISMPSAAARMAWMADRVPHLPGSGIIYTLTVRDAERVASWLQANQINAHAYHAEIGGPDRDRLEQQLLRNEVKALVATTALGMGFDKPDLGFVIHYQRPGSVVHYYQQVGRAGRAMDEAFGILLAGEEDEEITTYFINAAFPPEGRVRDVLDALNEADEGLSAAELEERLNLKRGQIEQVLRLLHAETPSPVRKVGSSWHATPVVYEVDREKVEALKRLRQREQQQMRAYFESDTCLMQFLANALDDPDPSVCGRCAVCVGRDLLPTTRSAGADQRAIEFLRRNDQVITPRRRWVGSALEATYGWRGNISVDQRAEPGRALGIWNDPAWGELVRRGKQVDGRFDEPLVAAAADMVRNRWRPRPAPQWVTSIPSLTHPNLVPDFARRLAAALGLPYVQCVRKTRPTQPQKDMQNSAQQTANLAGAFEVQLPDGGDRPLILVDDMVDSRWTFTVVAALLRQAGSGPVFPLALAVTSSLGD
jgi:ATP-dependent DNA helicase RecQ